MEDWEREVLKFENLVGKTLLNVSADDDTVDFQCEDGDTYRLYHCQDCCEYVRVEDVVGDLDDLRGKVLMATETSNEAHDVSESGTWTFYNIGTNKGCVTIRFLGESNGYYSESVDFVKL